MLSNKNENADDNVNVNGLDSQTSIDSIANSPSNNSNKYGSLSPFSKSPWTTQIEPSAANDGDDGSSLSEGISYNRLMGSLVREEGHIYSLAASGDLLYTGSDSKNIRVWKNQREFSGFKSSSGLVKSIVISEEKIIFTGHQDGKIRVWKMPTKNSTNHKKIATIPTIKAYLKKSINPSNYIEIGQSRNVLWIRHFDAISSLSLSEDHNFLYSASWDRTVKVWQTSSFKCLESIYAHDDAVNAVVAGLDGLVFTGSADGTVKIWRREIQGKGTKHFFCRSLLKQECAVTALAVDTVATIVYCGSSNGHVNFWKREDFNALGGVLDGHKLAVLCLATAGSLVFSGSADRSICVWKRIDELHVCLSTLTGHSGPVKCLAVEADGESKSHQGKWILYSGSLDKSVKMWRISEQATPEQQTRQDTQK